MINKILGVAVAATVLTSSNAFAQPKSFTCADAGPNDAGVISQQCTFMNMTNDAQASLDHLYLNVTPGGSLSASSIAELSGTGGVGGCGDAGPDADINNNNGSAQVTWPSNCIAVGDKVQITFTTDGGLSGVSYGVWDGYGADGGIADTTSLVPATPPWAIALLGLVLIVPGAYFIQRSRLSPANRA